ncbi:MAG: hypothetical protein RDU01_10065 [Thermodesulfovibrionales bacterium]|nr:hypothetical protein [Thermodesulfovibrionales bacterium]
MEMIRTKAENSRIMAFDTGCPYNGKTVCMASLSSMIIDGNRRAACCSTDNYDNCPIFLSKVLRGVSYVTEI